MLTDDEINYCTVKTSQRIQVTGGIDSEQSHAEAFQVLIFAIWLFERQEESNHTQLLQLKRISEQQVQKRYF